MGVDDVDVEVETDSQLSFHAINPASFNYPFDIVVNDVKEIASTTINGEMLFVFVLLSDLRIVSPTLLL